MIANKLLFGMTFILLCMVCTASAGEEEGRLKAASKAWEEAFNAGDAKTMAGIYTTDAMLLPPNEEPVQGRKSIGEFWAGFIEGIKGKLAIQEVVIQGDLAYLLGSFTIEDANGKIVDRGKYVEIWRRVDGNWRLSRDMWNTSLPQPGPAQ